MTGLPFIDLDAQQRRLGDRIERAIGRVLEHGHFIMGPEVTRLEGALAAFCGVRHAITCASGTDALVLAMRALGVRAGDGVFVPSFTFAATAEAVALAGATPVFVDVRGDTFNIDPASLAAAVDALPAGLRPAGVVPVDLFGQPAEYPAIAEIAERAGLWVVADAAQSFGAGLDGRRAGSFGVMAATSFFPAKPLGCYGDGGAVFTDDDELAATVRSLRVHGQGEDKYDNVRIGTNSRLDTVQAAVLLEKLSIFEDELEARQAVAERYAEGLAGTVVAPVVLPGMNSAWAQYTVTTSERDLLAKELAAHGIPTAVYYRMPLHLQGAYRDYPRAPGGLPVSEQLSSQVLSLPMHPYLDDSDQRRIVAVAREALR